MDTVSVLRKSDADKNQERYGASQFSSVLSKMQAGTDRECPTIKHHHHQRARRIDAEPMNLWDFPWSIGSFSMGRDIRRSILLFCFMYGFHHRLNDKEVLVVQPVQPCVNPPADGAFGGALAFEYELIQRNLKYFRKLE